MAIQVPRASLVPGMVPDEILAPLWRESITPYFDANPIGEAGTPVAMGFEYNSGNNPHFLDVEGIRKMNVEAGA